MASPFGVAILLTEGDSLDKSSASKQQLFCLSWQLVSRTSEGSQEQVPADYRCQSYCVWWGMTVDLNQSRQCHCI